MARTRGTKSSSPSSQKPAPRKAPVQASTSEPPRPEVVSPPVKPTPKKRQAKPTLQTPPARRYLTRSGGRSLQKRARVESSEPIDLTGQSPVPSPEPSPVPSPAPSMKPQASQPPPSEPQIPSGTAPEAIIKRPMLTQPPIEGNLDCRARPFHYELCFDIAAFQLRPELKGVIPIAAQISNGAASDPARLFLSQKKVHKKKLSRADAIPLFFPRLLCQILEHLGYPSEPQLERKRICREVFTFDKWSNMIAYRMEQPELPQPAQIPAARRASPRFIPEGIPVASPTIARAPSVSPVAPTPSQPSTSAEPRMAIPISEYRDLCQAL
ncbi:anther-specific proline-rich protein APG-like [Vitis riparia]|uniref:anther-specific proline-rich protein APG-like n=1 Tax=Vitis riparia TaxID=96939 RepID=UPI00155A2EE9|nr:anther-specific proline-rich protein APG-like [Vitis riparia]